MDLNEMKRTLESKSELKAAANSAEAKKLMEGIDTAALETAAKRGDTAALKDILNRVLSTPEGKALAQKVQSAVRRDG